MPPISSLGVTARWSEFMGYDEDNGESLTGTGGSTVFAQAGLRLWWKQLAFSAFYQPALLHNEGIDLTPTQHRIVVGLTYNLKTN